MSSRGTNFPGRSIERRRFVDKLLSDPVGAAAACVMLAIFMGCMSLSIGNRTVETPPGEEGILCQKGEVHLTGKTDKIIYYPIPYPRLPNIEISSTFDDCEIGEQRVDGFTLRNPNCCSRTVTWKARGIKCEAPPPSPALPSPPVPVPATGTLPAPTPVPND